jgi:hypothetical protein
MKMIYRVLFPACASFGPTFMVIGLQGPATTYGSGCAIIGALMTTAALFMLSPRVVDETRTVTPRERREQLLFWCVMVVIGVLIWFLSGRL